MKKKFSLKGKIVRLVVIITGILTLLSLVMIFTYGIQLKKHEEILDNITRANNMLVNVNGIVDTDIYDHLSDTDDKKIIEEIRINLDSLRDDMVIIKAETMFEDEKKSLRITSILLDSFMENFIEILNTNDMTQKLELYKEADELKEFIEQDINKLITMKIENRNQDIEKLKRNTVYSVVISSSLYIVMLIYFVLYGIKFSNDIVSKLDEEITEREKTENKLNYLANHDMLTSLVNRRYFIESVSRVFEKSLNYKRISILFLDLDGFKNINDTYGHDAGDYVIKSVSKTLLQYAGEYDIVARMGGDEFCILKYESCDRENLIEYCSRFIEEIAKDIMYNEKKLNVTVSIGVSIFPENGRNYDELIAAADQAMYEAKELGKNKYFICEKKNLLANN